MNKINEFIRNSLQPEIKIGRFALPSSMFKEEPELVKKILQQDLLIITAEPDIVYDRVIYTAISDWFHPMEYTDSWINVHKVFEEHDTYYKELKKSYYFTVLNHTKIPWYEVIIHSSSDIQFIKISWAGGGFYDKRPRDLLEEAIKKVWIADKM